MAADERDSAALTAELSSIADALGRLHADTDEEAGGVRALHARLARVVELLIARGVLSERDARLMEHLARASRPRVYLKQVADKRAVASPDIDCASLLHLCHGRCCSFRVELSPEDVREGKLRWELEEPYTVVREADGYCTHLRTSDAGGGCEHYADRPATCRSYDCRADPRVWVDFERQVAAPLPERVTPRFGR